MSLEPVRIGFLVEWAQVLVRADLLGMVGADWGIAGSAFLRFHFPVAEQIGRPATGAMLGPSVATADDSDSPVRHLHLEAHISAQLTKCPARANP
jgi:hypothetical protein